MSNDTPTDGKCNAETKDGGYCANPPVDGESRCRMHESDPDAGPPTGNEDADRDAWFEQHRDEVGDWVRALTASYVDEAPFDWSDQAKIEQVVEVAIDQARYRQSTEAIDSFLEEQVVGQRDDGTPVVQVEERPAHLPRDRIKQANLRVLKDLGVLDDPESDQAEVAMSIAKVSNEDN